MDRVRWLSGGRAISKSRRGRGRVGSLDEGEHSGRLAEGVYTRPLYKSLGEHHFSPGRDRGMPVTFAVTLTPAFSAAITIARNGRRIRQSPDSVPMVPSTPGALLTNKTYKADPQRHTQRSTSDPLFPVVSVRKKCQSARPPKPFSHLPNSSDMFSSGTKPASPLLLCAEQPHSGQFPGPLCSS